MFFGCVDSQKHVLTSSGTREERERNERDSQIEILSMESCLLSDTFAQAEGA